jgi:hypothetical protein
MINLKGLSHQIETAKIVGRGMVFYCDKRRFGVSQYICAQISYLESGGQINSSKRI